MSPVRLRLAKIQFCNGKKTCNKCFCFCNCAHTMHRMQRQQYQVRADFNEHFRKVWPGDLTLTWRYVSYCLHDVVRNWLYHHVKFNFSWRIYSHQVLPEANRVVLNWNKVTKSMSLYCSSRKHEPSLQWESCCVSLLNFKNWTILNAKKELTTK